MPEKETSEGLGVLQGCPNSRMLRAMDELQDLISRLRSEPPDRIRPLADETGIPYGTLRKLRSGSTGNPRYTTLNKLRMHYRERRADRV